MTWLIQSGEGDTVARFYSQKVARNLGSSLGWTEKRADATEFSSEAEAYEFSNKRMGMTMVRILEQKA